MCEVKQIIEEKLLQRGIEVDNILIKNLIDNFNDEVIYLDLLVNDHFFNIEVDKTDLKLPAYFVDEDTGLFYPLTHNFIKLKSGKWG